MALTRLARYFRDQATYFVSFDNQAVQRNVTLIFVIAYFFLLLAVFLPTVNSLGQTLWSVRSMLLVFPEEVMRQVDKI